MPEAYNGYAPTARTAVTVDWVVLLASLSVLLEHPIENPEITDTSLRNICVYALNGKYSTFAGDDPFPQEGGEPLGYNLHLCISDDTSKSPAFNKVCEKKIKYDSEAFVDLDQGIGLYICSEPQPAE